MNKAKKAMIIIAVIMLIAILTGKTVSASADAIRVYPDVPLEAGWAKPVYWASEKGYVQGFKGGRFGPEEDCTRQQFVIIVWRMNGRPDAGSGNIKEFSDVSAGSVYNPVAWASSNSVVNGYTDGTFRPDADCERRHIATILYRCASKGYIELK